MTFLIIWGNVVIAILLIYAFYKLKCIEIKTIIVKFKIILVVLSISGIFATFGENLIYLLISGIIAWVVLDKGNKKHNGHTKLGN